MTFSLDVQNLYQFSNRLSVYNSKNWDHFPPFERGGSVARSSFPSLTAIRRADNCVEKNACLKILQRKGRECGSLENGKYHWNLWNHWWVIKYQVSYKCKHDSIYFREYDMPGKLAVISENWDEIILGLKLHLLNCTSRVVNKDTSIQ